MLRLEGRLHFKKAATLKSARAAFLKACSGTFLGEGAIVEEPDTLRVRAEGSYEEAVYKRIADALYNLSEKAYSGHIDLSAPERGVLRYKAEGWISSRAEAVPKGALRRVGNLRFVQPIPVTNVAYAASGRRIVTAGASYGVARIWIWDAATGEELDEIRAHQRPKSYVGGQEISIAVSPDGARLISASFDGHLRAWDIQTARALAEHDHGASISKLAISPDGALLAVIAGGGDLAIYDSRSLELLRRIATGEEWLRQIAFGPGSLLAVISRDDEISIWDVSSEKRVRAIRGKHHLVAFSPDGKLAAVSCSRMLSRLHRQKEVRVFEAQTYKQILEHAPHASPVDAIAFSPDGREIVSASAQDPAGRLRFWDPASGETRKSSLAPVGFAEKMVYSPDGKTLAVAGGQAKLVLVDTATGLSNDESVESLFGACFSPDGAELALLSDHITLYDTKSYAPKTRLEGDRAMAYSPDGRVLAIGGTTLKLIELASGQVLSERKYKTEVEDLAFSPDGTLTASREKDALVLREVATGELAKKLSKKGAWPSQFAFSPTGQLVAVAYDESVSLFEPKKGKALASLEGHKGLIEALAFSPDGKKLALGSGDELSIWDIERREKSSSPKDTFARALAFSPDGKTLAAASGDLVMLYDTDTGELLSRRSGHEQEITALAFSPDGRVLVSASRDTSAVLWEMTPRADKIAAPLVPVASTAATDIVTLVQQGTADKSARAEKAKKGKSTERISPIKDGPALPLTLASETPARENEKATDRLRAKGSLWFDSKKSLEEGLSDFENNAYIEYYGRRDFVVEGLRASIDLSGELEVDCISYGESFQKISGHAYAGFIELFYEDSVAGQRFLARHGRSLPICPLVPPGALARHGAPFPGFGNAIAFSPGGARIFCARGGAVAVLEATTGVELAIVPTGGVYRLAAMPDGRSLITLGERNLSIWDIASGERVRSRKVPQDTSLIAVSPDGERIAFAAGKKKIVICPSSLDEQASTSIIMSARGEPYVRSLEFSPDGTKLLACYNSEQVAIWDAATGEELCLFKGYLSSASFYDDKTIAVSGVLTQKEDDRPKGADETISLLSLDQKAALRSFKVGKRIEQVLCTPDRKHLVGLYAYYGVLAVLDASSGERRWFQEIVREAQLETLMPTPDARALVSVSKTGGLFGVSLDKGEALFDHAHPLIAFACSEEMLATLDEGGALIVRDKKTGRARFYETIKLKAKKNAHLAFSPDGTRLALADSSALALLELTTGAWSDFEKNKLTAACFASSGRLLTGHGDGVVRVYEGKETKPTKVFTVAPVDIRRIAASADGRRGVVSAKDGKARVVDLETGKCIETFECSRDYPAVALSRDANLLAVLRTWKEGWSTNGEVVIWEVATGTKRGAVSVEPGLALAFSPDGAQIVASSGRLVVLMDTTSGERIGTLSGHLAEVVDLAFSADGQTLMSASADGTTLVWDWKALGEISFSHPSEHDGGHPWTYGYLADWMS